MKPLLFLVALLFATFAQAQTASFVRTDTVTQGNWYGIYGSTGELVEAGVTDPPTFAKVIFANQNLYTWAGSTPDVRALQNNGSRIASTWYSGTSFVIDINISDGQTHQLALYALDWDSYGGVRQETISITNGNGSAVLDTETLTNYTKGTYLIWNVSGHVQALITKTAGANAAISGIFFDPASGTVAPPPASQPPVICTCIHSVVLAWLPAPGAAHYDVSRGTTSGGPYTVIGTTPNTSYTDSLVTGGVSYFYVIQTISTGGTSVNSPELPVTIPLP